MANSIVRIPIGTHINDLLRNPGPMIQKVLMSFFDIDGTLLGKGHTIHPETIAALLKLQKSIQSTISVQTARPPFGFEPVIKILSDCGIALDGPTIAYTGAIALKPNGEILFKQTIENSLAVAAFKKAKELGLTCEVYTKDAYYLDTLNDAARIHADEYLHVPHIINPNLEDVMNQNDIFKFQITANKSEQGFIDQWKAHFPQLRVVTAPPGGHPDILFVSVVDPRANSGTALKAISEKYNVPFSRMLGAGDGETDVPMLKTVGVSIGMGNTRFDSVRESAKVITSHVDEGGLGKALEYFIGRMY